jgi:uncharacterized membrane protein
MKSDLFLPILIIALSVPLILELIPRNWFYGLRTRRTLSSDENWYPANRVGGVALAIAGAIWFVAELTLPRAYVTPIGLLAVLLAAITAVALSARFPEP